MTIVLEIYTPKSNFWMATPTPLATCLFTFDFSTWKFCFL